MVKEIGAKTNSDKKDFDKSKVNYPDYKWANYILGGLGVVLGLVGLINYYTGGGYFLGFSAGGFIGALVEGTIVLMLGYFVGKNKSIAFLLTAIIFGLEAVFKLSCFSQYASVGFAGVFIFGYATCVFKSLFIYGAAR
jgi:hypothetical protein